MWGWGFVDEGALRNAADKVSRHTVCQVELVSVSHHHCGYRADLGLSGFVSGSKSASAAAYSVGNPSCSVRPESFVPRAGPRPAGLGEASAVCGVRLVIFVTCGDLW